MITCNVCSLTKAKVGGLLSLRGDVYLLQEVWNPSPDTLDEVRRCGYDVHTKLRQTATASGVIRGGVAVLVRRSCFSSEILDLSSLPPSPDVEVLGVRLLRPNQEWRVASLYAVPDVQMDIAATLDGLASLGIHVIGADANARSPQWCPSFSSCPAGTSPDVRGRDIVSFLEKSGFTLASDLIPLTATTNRGTTVDLLFLAGTVRPTPAVVLPGPTDHKAVCLAIEPLEAPRQRRRCPRVLWHRVTPDALRKAAACLPTPSGVVTAEQVEAALRRAVSCLPRGPHLCTAPSTLPSRDLRSQGDAVKTDADAWKMLSRSILFHRLLHPCTVGDNATVSTAEGSGLPPPFCGEALEWVFGLCPSPASFQTRGCTVSVQALGGTEALSKLRLGGSCDISGIPPRLLYLLREELIPLCAIAFFSLHRGLGLSPPSVAEMCLHPPSKRR